VGATKEERQQSWGRALQSDHIFIIIIILSSQSAFHYFIYASVAVHSACHKKDGVFALQ
jgi:hypothetical protein